MNDKEHPWCCEETLILGRVFAVQIKCFKFLKRNVAIKAGDKTFHNAIVRAISHNLQIVLCYVATLFAVEFPHSAETLTKENWFLSYHLAEVYRFRRTVAR